MHADGVTVFSKCILLILHISLALLLIYSRYKSGVTKVRDFEFSACTMLMFTILKDVSNKCKS